MSRQTGADDAGFTPRSRSIQVEEFEVAIPGGIWVAIGAQALEKRNSSVSTVLDGADDQMLMPSRRS